VVPDLLALPLLPHGSPSRMWGGGEEGRRSPRMLEFPASVVFIAQNPD
jgi:hypothetical protein